MLISGLQLIQIIHVIPWHKYFNLDAQFPAPSSNAII